MNSSTPSGLDFLSAVAGARPADHLLIPVRSSSTMSANVHSNAVFSSNSNLSKASTSSSYTMSSIELLEALKNNVITTHQAQDMITQARATQAKKDRAKSFPQILMEILSNPDYASIISWLPSGKSFAIHDPNLFASLILPKYFRSQTIFRSFARKLNRWGFLSVKQRELKPTMTPTFEHGYFLRDFPELCGKMCHRRTTDQITKASEAIAVAGFSPSYGGPIPIMTDVYRTDQFMPSVNKLYPESSSESSLRALVNGNTALARSYGAPSLFPNEMHRIDQLMAPDNKLYPESSESSLHALVNNHTALAQSYGAPSLALSAFQVPQVSFQAAAASYITSSGIRHNEEFPFPTDNARLQKLENDLYLLHEMKRQRQRVLARHAQHLHQMFVVEATEAEVDDNVEQLLAAKHRQLLFNNAHQEQAGYNDHGCSGHLRQKMSVVKAMTEAEVHDNVTQLLAMNNRQQTASPRGARREWL